MCTVQYNQKFDAEGLIWAWGIIVGWDAVKGDIPCTPAIVLLSNNSIYLPY